MFRKIMLVMLLLLAGSMSLTAQEDMLHYRSEDGAVSFSYDDDWTLERQEYTYNTAYRYALLTPAYVVFQNPGERSQIFIEMISPDNTQYPQNLETVADYVSYTVDNELGEEHTTEDVEFAGHDAVQSSLISGYERAIRLIGFELDDGWILIASINAPENPASRHGNDLESGEDVLRDIIDSLVFDAELASIPFERNLPEYDTGDISLDETYRSEDGLFAIDYPSEWIPVDTSDLATLVAVIAYYAEFTVPDEDVEIVMMAFAVGDEYYNQAMDENTPDEYMYKRRKSDEGDVREFSVGEYDFVSLISSQGAEVTQELALVINQEWLLIANVKADSQETLADYESSVVATMSSYEFAIGAAFIEFPILSVELPEPWSVGSAYSSPENNNFMLQSRDPNRYQGANIYIYLADMEAVGLAEFAEGGLEELIQVVAQIEFETSIGTIADYEVLTGAVKSIGNEDYNEYASVRLFFADEKWLFFVVMQATSAEEVESMLEDVETIITDMTVNLP